jgi:hypothetical protein
VLPGAAEALGRENEVTIAKMHWLSDKGNGKMYGSMVIYVTKASDARQLLEERYFHLDGESASTNVFERRQVRLSATTAGRLVIKLLPAARHNGAASAPRRVIAIATARAVEPSVFYVEGHTSR